MGSRFKSLSSAKALKNSALATLLGASLAQCTYRTPKNADLTLLSSPEKVEMVRFKKANYPRFQGSDFLSFDQLVELSTHPHPSRKTQADLKRFLSRSIVSNEAYYQGKRPKIQRSVGLDSMLRVATWNIEKSLSIKEVAAALSSEEAYLKLLDPKKAPKGSQAYREALRQRERLATADVIFLQEMDLGVSRSDYVDAARHLAKALGMNYAYAPQSLEVDPALLGLESESGKAVTGVSFLTTPPALRYPKPDPKRYKGAFGSAVLTRYPILSAKVQQLEHQPYNWYTQEKKATDFVERGRRVGSAFLFENIITRELKVGGRHFFQVDIAVPDAPHQRVSLVNNHLEIKTLPKDRQRQMREILGLIQDIPNPVIMAGDHNSAPNDVSSTSFHKVLLKAVDNPTSFLTTMSSLSGVVTGTVIPLYRERGIVNGMKNMHHPLAPNIPLLFPNPVAGMFQDVEKFKFSDQSTFDFRGNGEHSINGRRGKLANSTEKKFYGYRPTFQLRRPIGPIGRFKLDWIFVRSGFLDHPRHGHQSYQFAPHYGETLKAFNRTLMYPLSDHHPMVVDSPFNHPDPKHESH